MELFGVLVRWIHFVGAGLLLGTFAFLVGVAGPAGRMAGGSALDGLAPLDGRLLRLARWLLAITVASGLLDLWRQVTVATGSGLLGSLGMAPVASVLMHTRYGTIWLVRHGLLLLLVLLLWLREAERDRADWLILRLEGALLAGASFGIIGAAGHAASAQQFPLAAIAVDGVHLLATGLWFGALLPLVLFLTWTLTLPDPTGSALAARAARRFSALGLGSVAVLVLTGTYNAWEQVAGFPALIGTSYGRWLSLKLALLLPLLGVAALNLLVLKPRLLRTVERRDDHGRSAPLIARLRRHVTIEAALGCAILGVVAVLGLTTPARHSAVSWPLSFRLSWEATRDLPGVQTRVAIGGQLALLGLIAALLAVIVQTRRWRQVAVAGVAGIVLGLTVALPPLAVDAYPTTYRRPTVPYAASSIADGLALYRRHCVACHGPAGYGDGPAAARLPQKPADLTAKHTGDHTVGDLFWWLTHGIGGTPMPGFGAQLSDAERWDVINALRTLAAAERTRELGPVAGPTAIVAPDFEYTTGVGESHTLREHRGQGPVLLVLFSLPGSLPRLTQLGDVYPSLRRAGAEVLAIPLDGGRDIYRRIGDRLVFFPIVVDGAADAAAAYLLFRPDPYPPLPRHLELLIDRQGYLRARFIPDGPEPGWRDPWRLVAEVERLAKEMPRTLTPDEHVH